MDRANGLSAVFRPGVRVGVLLGMVTGLTVLVFRH
jgi:hypothetical protein